MNNIEELDLLWLARWKPNGKEVKIIKTNY